MYQLRKKNLADNVVIYGRGRELFRRDADHSPPSTAEVTNEWSYTFSPTIRPHGAHRDLYLYFTLYKTF